MNILEDIWLLPTNTLASRLEQIEVNFKIDETKVLAYCHCIQLDGDWKSRVNDLIDCMVEHVVDYAIPKKKRAEAERYLIETGSSAKYMRLRSEAIELFTDINKTGEWWELLLFLIAKEILWKPPILSKMSLKTNGNVHYHWADWVYFDYNNELEELSLYWWESKMYSDLNKGLDKCIESLKDFLLDLKGVKAKQERDLQLVSDNLINHINDEKLEDLLVWYFDKDSPLSNKVKYKWICFVWFDYDWYPDLPNTKTMTDLKIEMQSHITERFSQIKNVISKTPWVETFEIHFFIIPFKSVQDFRDYFIERMK